jgi:predicted nuclease of predicted toxin-antitoxin system
MCIRLLFDQNLSYRLVARLKEHYPGSVHVATLGLESASDIEVWKFAKENRYTLVTKDSDFNDICTLHDFPPHIIWLRLGNSRVSKAEESLIKFQTQICSIVEENETGIIEINL